MNWISYKIGDILKRRKSLEKILPAKKYKLVTIKLYHRGVVLRKEVLGSEIGSSMSSVMAGDFILSGIDARNGAFGIVPQELHGAVVTNDFWCLEPDIKIIDKEFLLYLTTTDFFDQICKQSSDGTTQRIRLQKDKFFDFKIDLPPINEQLIILDKLRNLSNVNIELNTQLTHLQSLLKQLRQAFLREAMQGKLVKQDKKDGNARDLLEQIKAEKAKLIAEKKLKKEKPLPPIKPEEIPFEIPEGWVWCRFNDIAIIESNLVSPFKYLDHPHVAPDNIEKHTGKLKIFNTVREDEVKSANHYFYPGQLIYSKVRPQLNKVIKVDFEGLCSADMYPLRSLINSDFLLYCMLSEYFLIEVNKFDNRVKMPKINQNQLSQIHIPIPPISEQVRISSRVEKLMKICDELLLSIEQSKEQNEKLLHQVLKQMLVGKIEC